MSEKVVITLDERKIRGIKQTSKFSGIQYFSFFGVPYGQAPINNLRFKDPLKIKPWNGTYDATSEKSGCIQFSLTELQFTGTEDCLYTDIHLTQLPLKDEPMKPVIVNVHPGAFLFGNTQKILYGSPDFVMQNDIVYICIAFRLHILGFLNLGLKECSGNQAIKDIILGLQWIKDNISWFGGDPENITLLGSSSGAAMINMLMLSPSAKGLFHKAVLMGAYLQSPVVSHQETNENHARRIATALGYYKDIRDHKKLLRFLKKQSVIELIQESRTCQKDLQEDTVPIIPMCVFSPSLDKGSVLPEWSEALTKSIAPIPLMIGFSQRESIMGFTRNLRPSTEKNFKRSIRQNFFGWGYHLTDDDIELINEEVQDFYTNGQSIENADMSTKIDIQSDIIMSDVYDSMIHPISENLPESVFMYKFEFQGNLYTLNPLIKNLLDEPIEGTYHGADFSYWNRFGDPQDERTRDMIKTFTKLVATFAKKGDPNFDEMPIHWRPYTTKNPCYLSINSELKVVNDKLNEKLEFWDRIKKKFKK